MVPGYRRSLRAARPVSQAETVPWLSSVVSVVNPVHSFQSRKLADSLELTQHAAQLANEEGERLQNDNTRQTRGDCRHKAGKVDSNHRSEILQWRE